MPMAKSRRKPVRVRIASLPRWAIFFLCWHRSPTLSALTWTRPLRMSWQNTSNATHIAGNRFFRWKQQESYRQFALRIVGMTLVVSILHLPWEKKVACEIADNEEEREGYQTEEQP